MSIRTTALATFLIALSSATAQEQAPDLDGTEAFLDGFVTSLMGERDVVGASLAVVAGDEVLVARGFGKRGESAKTDADTMFRTGSITKVLTWTAVLQLVEAGTLDLDTDITTYLDGVVEIPTNYDEPITLGHLMSHTPGFEDRVIGLFGKDQDSLAPLAELLAAQMPARVRPPGTIASYSNHGTALAALVVERVTGSPWAEVVESRILGPLGMERTTVRQPIPEALTELMSTGYRGADDPVEAGFEFVPLAPAGSMSASAGDMARFMIAYLSGGALGDARILGEETTGRMFEPLHVPFEGSNVIGHGFYEMSRDGIRIFGHGGDTMAFHSVMALLPDHGLGLFFSVNSESGGGMPEDVLDAALDRWFPGEDEDEVVVESPADADDGDDADEAEVDEELVASMQKFAGDFRACRYSHSTFAKLAAVGSFSVEVDDEGSLSTPFGTFSRDDAGRFVAADSEQEIGFVEDDSGAVTHLLVGDIPVIGFERAPTQEAMPFQRGLAISAVVAFLLTLLSAPVMGILRMMMGVERREDVDRLPRLVRWIGWLTAAGFTTFLVMVLLSNPTDAAFGVPPLLDQAFWVPLATTLMTAILTLCLLVVSLRKSGSLFARFRLFVLTLLSIGFTWQLWLWNLLDLERARSLWERITS